MKYQQSSGDVSKISPITIEPRSSDSQLRDTIHYLSPVSSARAKADICICDDYECICEEATSYRFTEISTEEGTQVVEKTLAIIKPDGFQYEDVVLRKLRLEGFQVIAVIYTVFFKSFRPVNEIRKINFLSLLGII